MVYGNSSFFGYMWHVVHNRENLQSSFLQEVAVFPLRELGLRFFGLFCAGVWNEDDTPTNDLKHL